MSPILDLEDHEHFSLDEFSVKTWCWIVEVKGESVVFIENPLSFVLKSPELLTSDLRIFHGHGSFHIFKV
jgi:hypothetical protein